MIYIVGSGLSGIATASALVKRGIRPTILDAGLRPDSETVQLKARLASVEPDRWNPEDLAQLKRTGPTASTGIPRKLHFGSNFAYRDVDTGTAVNFEGVSILRSFAQGGFSNVWGAVIQELPENEFHCWPVGFQQLATHYAAVGKFICPSEVLVQPSVQARALHSDLVRHRDELDRNGIRFDYSTLAVRGSGDSGKGCRYCGVCLYGCPYDSIFAATSELTRMVRQGQISYIPGVLVDRISTTNRRVRIEARSSSDNAARTFDGQSVFLAAGLLETARIILNSTSRPAIALQVRQSDIFTIPILRYASTANISEERIHTLCQMIVEISDASISPHSVQLQLYGYNDLYARILARRAGPRSSALRPLFQGVTDRLFVAFGYLHSDVSSRVWIKRAASGKGRLYLEGRLDHEAKSAGRAVARKLARLRKYFRAVPVPLMLRFDNPGGGHRSGGCFPMRKAPVGLETDPWGRIPGLAGVHIVDASILPSVPARPLAFTVMANAHRIASECPVVDVA